MKFIKYFLAPLSLIIVLSCASSEEGIEIGKKAIALEYDSPDGKPISLASLKGKIVMIDFWASWCPPCRRENPVLVEAYHKFKDKKFTSGNGFTIYSVSLDKKKESWEKAILDDKLEWDYHVSDLGYWDSEAALKYNIEAIPSNLILDGKGIILAKNLRGEELNIFLTNLLKQ